MAELGRPSDYRPEFCQQVRKLVSKGATPTQVADFFDVSTRTIYRWRNEYEEFRQAFDATREEADQIVVSALFQRATGYEVDAVKIFCDKDGNVTEVPYREIVPPDVNAAKFWLTNRSPEQWRDKTDHEMYGPNGGAIPVSLEIDL